MPMIQTRRRFLTNAELAGAAGLGGFWGKSLAAEAPLEITTIRFEKDPVTCIAPEAFQELLRAEGFADIRYMDITKADVRRADAANSEVVADMIARGEVDFGRNFAPSLVLGMNAGAPITVLSGLHLGCFEIFGKNEIRTLGDLKGRTVGVSNYNSAGDKPLLTITCPMFLARTSCKTGGLARKASILPSTNRSIGCSDGSVTQRKSLAGSRPTKLAKMVSSGLSAADA